MSPCTLPPPPPYKLITTPIVKAHITYLQISVTLVITKGKSLNLHRATGRKHSEKNVTYDLRPCQGKIGVKIQFFII